MSRDEHTKKGTKTCYSSGMLLQTIPMCLCSLLKNVSDLNHSSVFFAMQSCVLCGHSEGAMKALASDKKRFAHILCALWSPRIGFRNYYTLTGVTGMRSPRTRP